MRFSRADVLALLVALAASVAGVVVWNHGTVDLGLTLRADDGRVSVHDVTPGGLAARNGFYPGVGIIYLTRADGGPVELGEPIEAEGGSFDEPIPWEFDGPFPFGSVGGPLEYEIPTEFRLPVEAVEKDAIGAVAAGEVVTEQDFNWVSTYSSLDRRLLEYELRQSIGIAVGGLLLGILVWRLLVHGLGGPVGRKRALVAGAAVATPALILPVVLAGTPLGVGLGFLFPAAAALVLGLAIAREHPDRAWSQTAMAGSLVAGGLAALLVLRYITAPSLAEQNFGTIFAVIAAIGVVPALVVASASGRTIRQRASVTSLGMLPAAAMTLIGPPNIEPVLPIVLVGLLLGWQLLPIERALSLVGGGLSRVRSTTPASAPAASAPSVGVVEPIVPAALRDTATIVLFGVVVLLGLFRDDSALGVLGVMLAGMVGLAVRGGILGPHWADAAIPLAVAVGLPVAVSGYSFAFYDGTIGWLTAAVALVGLSVADVLAARHSDPLWRQRLMFWSIGIAAIPVIFWLALGSDSSHPLAFLFGCLVPLIPGLPVAFAADHDEPRAISARLETLVVALTLLVSALVLTPLAWVPLVAWFIAIVVWRRFTLAPLLGLAQRTQLQRDLAVAAAETERARLAADLHDDALQQLSMLVRTLDESGNTAAADEAREIATKLRSVVGDLRLPILDDLGAGAALEWLVERVEPLAGGPVKLERSDASRPPANVELAVFRVAQEALTNAIKHGRPPIAVRYDVRTDGRVTLAIDDAGDGIGAEAAETAPREGHFGLANMQQRAEQIGGLLDVRRWPAGGTRVALEWRPQ